MEVACEANSCGRGRAASIACVRGRRQLDAIRSSWPSDVLGTAQTDAPSSGRGSAEPPQALPRAERHTMVRRDDDEGAIVETGAAARRARSRPTSASATIGLENIPVLVLRGHPLVVGQRLIPQGGQRLPAGDPLSDAATRSGWSRHQRVQQVQAGLSVDRAEMPLTKTSAIARSSARMALRQCCRAVRHRADHAQGRHFIAVGRACRRRRPGRRRSSPSRR